MHRKITGRTIFVLFCFNVLFGAVGPVAAEENGEGRSTPAVGNPSAGEGMENNSVELLPADPNAKPLIPGKTYSLKDLSKNTITEEREFFTNAYLVLCAPAPCPPCPEGAQCAPCEQAVLYFADQPLKGKTEKELKDIRDVLAGHHYEFCPELSKYTVGKKHRLKVAVQNISFEEGMVYNEIRIVEPE
jgi:hypothetical protein